MHNNNVLNVEPRRNRRWFRWVDVDIRRRRCTVQRRTRKNLRLSQTWRKRSHSLDKTSPGHTTRTDTQLEHVAAADDAADDDDEDDDDDDDDEDDEV